MDKLPVESAFHGFVPYVDHGDFKTSRQVNKHFAKMITPLRFTVLRFLSPGHRTNPKPTLKFSELQEAVAEVLPAIESVEKLTFSPAFSQKGAPASEPIDEAHLPCSPDEEINASERYALYQARMQAVEDAYWARVERQRQHIVEAEEAWKEKSHEQEQASGDVEASLQELFQHMPRLQELEVRPWEFNDWDGLLSDYYQTDGPYVNLSVAVILDTISKSLEKSNRHIEKLIVHAFNPELAKDSPAMRHTFTGLHHLSLGIDLVDSLLEDAPTNRVIPALLKCSQHTLQHLEIFSGGKFPQFPSQGVHFLSKVLNDGETDKALCLPNLRTLRLRSLLVDTKSLLDFVTAQPKLSDLKFGHVCLVTPGMGWVYLVTHLPKAVQKWEAFGKLGHEPVTDFERVVSSSACIEWDYYNQPIPAGTSWEGRDTGMETQFRRIGAWPADQPDGFVTPRAPQITAPFPEVFVNLQWPPSIPPLDGQ
ncbi:unnamed protein product [Clonostachys solani]|uniref:Uncharacterized protein n=1 Tax=Clonostachys solani TaxID=160281 RepID=A0A9N9WA48_9HYPO|nr:unnamed protein product [Clonostachys solani]